MPIKILLSIKDFNMAKIKLKKDTLRVQRQMNVELGLKLTLIERG